MSSSNPPQSTVDADVTFSPPISPYGDPPPSNESPPQDRSPYRVRFRSRVRITSGIHRHRPGSLSVSPSSSIDAPLRSQTDLSTSALGPLGLRTHLLSRGRDTLSRLGTGRKPDNDIPGERTPLKSRSPYVNIDDDYYTTNARERLNIEMDEAWKWPKRLLNLRVCFFLESSLL
jgi:hypothetical protein